MNPNENVAWRPCGSFALYEQTMIQQGIRVALGTILFGLLVFAWPMALVQAKEHYQESLVGEVLANMTALCLSPLYVMFVLRGYAFRESVHFCLWRYSECI
jgi:hypothetical protein